MQGREKAGRAGGVDCTCVRLACAIMRIMSRAGIDTRLDMPVGFLTNTGGSRYGDTPPDDTPVAPAPPGGDGGAAGVLPELCLLERIEKSGCGPTTWKELAQANTKQEPRPRQLFLHTLVPRACFAVLLSIYEVCAACLICVASILSLKPHSALQLSWRLRSVRRSW